MAAMVAAAALADEPTAEVDLGELSGNASVTFGIDLDEGKTGFKNEGESTLKINIANKGSKSTEGDGVWAELKAEVTQDVKFKSHGSSTDESGIGDWDGDNGGKVKVAEAKIHIGSAYISILKGNTQVGAFKVPNAIMSADNDNAVRLKDVIDEDKHSWGVTLGYGTDDFGLDFDFRSSSADAVAAAPGTNIYEVMQLSNGATAWEVADADNGTTVTAGHVEKGKIKTAYATTHKILRTETVGATAAEGTNYYTNNYALAAEAKLNDTNSFVPGLFADFGVTYQLKDKNFGLGFNAGYKLPVGETFYVKPTVGLNMVKPDGIDATMNLVGGVLFGWGDTADANAGVPYLDGDYAKKVTPGVGVAFAIPDLTADGNKVIALVPSFYSGELVPNLTAAAVAEIDLVTGDGAPDPTIAVAGGVKYTLEVGDSIKVSPYAGGRFISLKGAAPTTSVFYEKDKGIRANTDNGGKKDTAVALTDDSIVNVKLGAEISGLLNNTTFNVFWQSRNLTSDSDLKAKVGTVNFSCKIAL